MLVVILKQALSLWDANCQHPWHNMDSIPAARPGKCQPSGATISHSGLCKVVRTYRWSNQCSYYSLYLRCSVGVFDLCPLGFEWLGVFHVVPVKSANSGPWFKLHQFMGFEDAMHTINLDVQTHHLVYETTSG